MGRRARDGVDTGPKVVRDAPVGPVDLRTPERPTLLLVDDDPLIRRLVERVLSKDEIQVIGVADARRALQMLAQRRFDLLLVDVMLPSIDGIELSKKVVAEYSTPIVLISAKDSVEDVLAGMEAGALDYITKPFDVHDLRERVRESLQRARPSTAEGLLRLGDLELDTKNAQVRRGGTPVHLSITEFRLLVELATHRGEVRTREQLLRDVWGASETMDTRLVDMAITRLRKKIASDPSAPRLIKTVRGRGYTIDNEDT